MRTVNDNSRCGASSFCHYVLRHTRVVGRVRQTRLLDDQVVVNGDVEVSVLCWVNYLFILQPLHLGDEEGQEKIRSLSGFMYQRDKSRNMWLTGDDGRNCVIV